jgi:hypothetical protein
MGTHRESVVEAFDEFRQEIDEHHDRRERLIKVWQALDRINCVTEHHDSDPFNRSVGMRQTFQRKSYSSSTEQ